jgi:hypothetical protein
MQILAQNLRATFKGTDINANQVDFGVTVLASF